MALESKITIQNIQRKFGEVAVDVQRCKRQGEVALVGGFNSRIGKASKLNDNIGRMGKKQMIRLGKRC